MKRVVHELVQGSPEWHQFRLDHFGASEAAAMLGISKNVSRSELLRHKHTGIAQEFSDWFQTNVLDHGREVEALARPIIEAMLDEELYPATYSYGKLSASCDGLTMAGDTALEHKQWNAALAETVRRGELPDEHQAQCQQIMLVTGAERVVFVVSDGTKDKFILMKVEPDAAWQKRIKTGWKQFEADLTNYQVVEVAAEPGPAPTMSLPALFIKVDGQLALTDNLKVFGAKLAEFIDGLDKNPSTDQAFADAEAAIKTLQQAQEVLEASEASALAQTASIDEMRRTVALYVDQARSTRLLLEKLVKTRKEQIRVEIIQAGNARITEHIVSLNKRLGKPYMPAIAGDLAGVIKGKKTITSLRDAVDTEVARIKIEANEIADRIQMNLNALSDLGKDYGFLFADAAQLVLKENDGLVALIKVRIAEHEAAETRRLESERERIRQEEQAKAGAAVAEKERQLAADREHILQEERARTTREQHEHDEQRVAAAQPMDQSDAIREFLNTLAVPEKKKREIRPFLIEFVKFMQGKRTRAA